MSANPRSTDDTSCGKPLPRDVVLLSTADWDHPFWTNKQHVARQLARRGFRVLYVESLGLRRPAAQARDMRRVARRAWRALQLPRRIEQNLWVSSPLVWPAHGRSIVRGFNDRFLLGQLRRAMRRLGMRKPIVWTYNPLTERLAARLQPSMLVYHCVDDLRAAPGLPTTAIEELEPRLARSADVVFATSPALHARLKQLNQATHYFPNVADYEHFAKARQPGPIPADLDEIPHPRIGFIGAISDYKLDFEWIAAVARQRPAWQWVLIGQMGEGQPASCASRLNLPNVHLLGPRPYEALPHYLRGFDVATIPAARNAYTTAMFPMKFFEYLAAGRPVVASHVPALESFADACSLVDTPSDFIAAIERALRGAGPEAAIGTRLAQRYTWQWRTDEMLAILYDVWRARSRNSSLQAA